MLTNVPFSNAKGRVIINDITENLPIFIVINNKGWGYTEDVKKFKTIRQFTDENIHLNACLIGFDWTSITSPQMWMSVTIYLLMIP